MGVEVFLFSFSHEFWALTTQIVLVMTFFELIVA